MRGGPRAERADATRVLLLDAGRELFAERGYAAVGTEEVVRRAGVTRGALYHHFRDKRDLFRAVYEQVEERLIASIAAEMGQAAPGDPWELFMAGVRSFLDQCGDPAVMRISLRDAPEVLGREEWRAIGERYALGMVTGALRGAVEAGVMRGVDVDTLAQLLLSAFSEAALLIATAEDPADARPRVEETLMTMLDGLRA